MPCKMGFFTVFIVVCLHLFPEITAQGTVALDTATFDKVKFMLLIHRQE